jgi:hypothetical protein
MISQVVNGSDQMILFLVNSTAFDVVSGEFNLTCGERDEPSRCSIPASYVYAAEPWDAASSAANVTLAVRSVNHPMVGAGVQLTMSPSCASGFVVNISVAGPRLQLPFSFFPNVNRTQLCKSCSSGTVSDMADAHVCFTCPAGTAAAANQSICVSCFGNSWAPPGTQGSCIDCPVNFKATRDFDDCVSLEFSGFVPRSIVARVPFVLPCINVVNLRGHVVNASNGSVSIILGCTFPL